MLFKYLDTARSETPTVWTLTFQVIRSNKFPLLLVTQTYSVVLVLALGTGNI